VLNKSRTLLNKLLKHSLHHKPPIFLKVNKYTPTKLVSWSTAQLIFYARICARTNGAQFMCRRMSTFSTRVYDSLNLLKFPIGAIVNFDV